MDEEWPIQLLLAKCLSIVDVSHFEGRLAAANMTILHSLEELTVPESALRHAIVQGRLGACLWVIEEDFTVVCDACGINANVLTGHLGASLLLIDDCY